MQRFWFSLLLLLALTVTLHPLSASILAANITSDISVPDVWTYTISNNEAPGSSNFVDQFTIAISAAITVTAQPAGWDNTIGLTDGVLSITWFSTDPSTDLAPGGSLSGFSFSSPGSSNVLANAVVNSWDHVGNVPGPDSVAINVDSPQDVPEPWTGSTMGLALLVGSMWLRKKSRRASGSVPVPPLTAC